MLRPVGALWEILVKENEALPLDLAAFQLAQIETPELDLSAGLAQLDALAGELERRLGSDHDEERFVATANQYLFEELGFRGNQDDYYHPDNSCLNRVIELRMGLPITLSVLYVEVARRLRQPVVGIGLPGHFLVQYRGRHFQTFIDPFHGGRLLAAEDCRELAQQAAGVDVADDLTLLQPVSKRQILLRMLNNLRAVYFQRRAYTKALSVMDLLVAALPEAGEEHRQRAMLHLQLRRYRQAMTDLRQYLTLVPDARDRAEVEQQIVNAARALAALN